MGETTHISWADRTWSPWTGCTKISPACDGCYAAHLMDTRMGRVEWGEPGAGEGTRDLMSAAYWRKPLQWDREAAKTGVRPWVFPSLCDPFDLAVPDAWHARFHELIISTPNVQWLLLTKRVGNVRKVADLGAGRLWSATNWMLGSTFANQAEWDRDFWKLRDAAAAFMVQSFGSFEPLLSRIDFHGSWLPDWVIAGGETDQGGHKARPPSAQWFRELRDQCAAAGVPFHFKQWGEWAPGITGTKGPWAFGDSAHDSTFWPSTMHVVDHSPREFAMFGSRSRLTKVGKQRAGRMLDGVVHDARPEPQ